MQRVVLHAVDLQIDAGRIALDDGTVLELETVEYDPVAERASLAFEAPIVAGEWTLHLEFTGTLNDRLRGFYRSTYTDAATGTKHTLAATQFESADARRAFPCWDEPDRKAVFGIRLIVPQGLAAVSNGPEIARTPVGDGTDEVRFGDTMVMSTYLVAFVVGRLEVGEPRDVDGVPVRIVHVPGKAHLTGFALEVGRVLSALLPLLLRHPVPGREGGHDRPSRLRAAGPWRTPGASRTARACCWLTPPMRPSPSWRTSPT